MINGALNLKSLGCQKGQTIMFAIDNSGDITPLVCAALCLGCKITGQPSGYTDEEILFFFNLMKPDFVICDIQYYAQLKKCLENLNNCATIITFGGQINGIHSVDSLLGNDHLDPFFV